MNGVIRDGQQAGKAVVTGKTGAGGVRPASVTVIIPVYNGEEFVERTVRSAAGQTYPELRILAVNDGSTDGTEAILARLAAEVANFSYVTTPNGGVARARNTGTEMADSTYVAYLDADDLWHPTKIAKQVAALQITVTRPGRLATRFLAISIGSAVFSEKESRRCPHVVLFSPSIWSRTTWETAAVCLSVVMRRWQLGGSNHPMPKVAPADVKTVIFSSGF